MSKAVYLSGAILGKTYAEARCGWRKEFADKMEPGISVLSPMRHEGHLAEIRGTIEDDNIPTNLFALPKMIVAKDLLDIDNSALVVAYLNDTDRVSRGTLMEIAYAYAKGKPIVTVMGPGNVHDYPFVHVMSDVVVETLDEAVAIVNSLLSEGL